MQTAEFSGVYAQDQPPDFPEWGRKVAIHIPDVRNSNHGLGNSTWISFKSTGS